MTPVSFRLHYYSKAVVGWVYMSQTLTRLVLKKRLAIYHCHTTGKVRGLLCVNCNLAIGLLKDNPDLLNKAASYLKGWS
jgi:hypothetical protein